MTAPVLTHARFVTGADNTSTPARAPRSARTPRFARAAALLSAAFVALGASFGVASPALAHDELVGYDVLTSSGDSSVTGFTLHFSNEIMDIGSEINATDHHGADVTDGAPTVSGRDVTQKLLTPLEEGSYSIAWRVVSSDGHPIQGALSLSVASDGSGEILVAPVDGGEGDQEHGSETANDDSDEGHSHDDEATSEVAITPISAQTGGAQPWWLWAVVGLVGAGVVAAIVAGTVVGQKRRREAFGAADDAAENTADEADAR